MLEEHSATQLPFELRELLFQLTQLPAQRSDLFIQLRDLIVFGLRILNRSRLMRLDLSLLHFDRAAEQMGEPRFP